MRMIQKQVAVLLVALGVVLTVVLATRQWDGAARRRESRGSERSGPSDTKGKAVATKKPDLVQVDLAEVRRHEFASAIQLLAVAGLTIPELVTLERLVERLSNPELAEFISAVRNSPQLQHDEIQSYLPIIIGRRKDPIVFDYLKELATTSSKRVSMAAIYGLAIQRFDPGESDELKATLWKERERAAVLYEGISLALGRRAGPPFFDVEQIADVEVRAFLCNMAQTIEDPDIVIGIVMALRKSVGFGEVDSILRKHAQDCAKDIDLRISALSALIDGGRGEIVVEVVRSLDPADRIINDAIRLLADYGGEIGVRMLKELAITGAKDEIRGHALEGLVKGGNLSEAEFRELYFSPINENLRFYLLKGLRGRTQQISYSETVFLLNRLKDGNFSERSWAASVLKDVRGYKEVFDAMKELLKDDDAGLRSGAIEYFAQRQDPISRSVLQQIAETDSDEGNRRRAAEALRR